MISIIKKEYNSFNKIAHYDNYYQNISFIQTIGYAICHYIATFLKLNIKINGNFKKGIGQRCSSSKYPLFSSNQ